MRIKMPAVRIAQDSDTTEPESTQDIITCGSCQKIFALADICKFIQHKVLQCNKENYGQCFPQGAQDDRDSDDGRPLSLANSRRPTISAPISGRKSSSSRVHTPPHTSPAELLGDGASSTPKSITDENENSKQIIDTTQTTVHDHHGVDDDDDLNHHENNNRTELNSRETRNESSCNEEESSVSSGQPLLKKLKTEVADAESNTTHSEPSNYMCSTCKTRLHSAWRLVQHVQNTHGVKIYVDSSSTSLSSATSATSMAVGAAQSTLNNILGVHHHHQQQQQQQQQNTLSAKSLKDLSGSSSCSSTSETSTSHQQQRPQSNSSQHNQSMAQNLPPPGLRHHPLMPPHDLHSNPFGLLRMPLPPMSQGPVPTVGPLFSRPHPDHFRMEQLVSEQFRHHGLSLAAAAAAAANSLAPHNQNFSSAVSSTERPPSSGSRSSLQNIPTSVQQSLGIEPQMDFYSQRLRQLAGTTSPGAGAGGNSSSPSPRKQQSPPFASPSPSQLPPTPLTNNSRPQSLTPPGKQSELISEAAATITNTPRSSSTPPSKMNQGATDAIHSCDFCGKKFRFQSNLLVHRRGHTGEKPYKCPHCDFICAQNSKLRQHLKIHRTPEDRASNSGSVETLDGDESPEDLEEEEEAMDEEDEEEEYFNDDKCEDEAEDLRVSSTKDALKEMREMGHHHASPASLVGELMDKFGLSNIAQYSEAYKQALQESGNALKLHLTSKDRDNNNSASAIHPFPDKLNGLPAALRLREEFAKNMLHHQQQQAQSQVQVPMFNPFENPFEASKRIKLENAFEASKRIKFDGSEGWWNLTGLHREGLFDELNKKHHQNHSGPGGMMQTSHAKKEQKRNDTCEFCGKVFKNCSNLTVHRRSHTGEKPYKCELCSYACAQSSKLTRHMKTHGRMGKDVYRCRFCDMPFSVPSTLEKHMRKCVVNQGKAAHQQQQQQQQNQQGLTPPGLPVNNNGVGLGGVGGGGPGSGGGGGGVIPLPPGAGGPLMGMPNGLAGLAGLQIPQLPQMPQMMPASGDEDSSSSAMIKKETA